MNTKICPGSEAGQVEDLVARIRGLIRDYPPGLGVIKEFLQNADDAGATKVTLTLDLRTHPSSRIPDQRMPELFGPALLISSDQVFSTTDLIAIQQIGEGSKRQQGPKTGRFGLGFNTAYNITDYPAFATGDRIICFDPHRDAVAQNGRPGRQWLLADLWTHAPDWPRAFGLTEDEQSLNRTVFRLPLRTTSQAKPERISARAFFPKDVRLIFNEMSRAGGALLLFLRHVIDLEANIINEDESTASIVAQIQTINPDDVQENRSKLHDACAGKLSERLKEWTADPERLPKSTYEHRFLIRQGRSNHEQSWLISCGLFADKHGHLLNQAQEMLDIGEKALPLAGAAVLVNGQGVADVLTGSVYCALPLAIETPLRFHINGYFDLDSSRTQISYAERPVGDAAVRVQWNLKLLEHGVAPAAATLFQALAEKSDRSQISKYYEIWPNTQKLSAAPLSLLGKFIYAKFSQYPLLRTRAGTDVTWMKPVEVRAPAWSALLSKALCDDGLRLFDPRPPEHVLAGLKELHLAPSQSTATDLRVLLQWEQGLEVSWRKTKYSSLRRKSFIIDLIRFVLKDKKESLIGFPLAITEDGTIRRFGDKPVCLGSDEVRSLFRERQSWFIDQEVEKEGLLKADVHAKILLFDDSTVIRNLTTFLGTEAGSSRKKWAPTEATLPNEAWLLELFQYLAKQDAKKHHASIRALAILPDQHQWLHRPGMPDSPLLPPDGLPEAVQAALTLHGVPLVTAGADLLMAIRMCASKHPDLVRPLSGANLVDVLMQVQERAASVAVTSSDRHVLLDFICEQDRRSPLDGPRLKALGTLPIWPTEQGLPSAASGADVYIPADYLPPAFTGKLTLLNAGADDRWRALLLRIGVVPLRLGAYLEQVFLKVYPGLEREQQRTALRWLRDEVDLALLSDQEQPKDAERIRKRLREASLVLGHDGVLHRASDLYYPEAERDWGILGPVAICPDLSYYADSKDAWLRLFSSLGMHRTPRASDLLLRIDHLVALARASSDAFEDVEKHLLAMLFYIDEHWEGLKAATVDSRNNTLATALVGRAWLPALRDTMHAASVAGHTIPDTRLFRPDELYPRRLQHLVASQAPLLATTKEPHAELRKALGIPARVPLKLAVQHFCTVRKKWMTPDHGGLSAQTVGEMSREFYALVGRIYKPSAAIASDDDTGTITPPKDLNELIQTLNAEPSVWHQESELFWGASHVFARPVPFFGPWRISITAANAEGVALDLLGRRAEPASEDFVQFLKDLAESQAGRPLGPQEQQYALHAIQRLSGDDAAEQLTPDLPLLTRAGFLLPASQILLDDAPWWSDRLSIATLHWLHPGIAPKQAYEAGVSRASELIEEVLLEQKAGTGGSVARMCLALEQHLRCREFLVGLLRLVQAKHGAVPVAIERSASLSVIPVVELRTGLRCIRLLGEMMFGEAEVQEFVEDKSVFLTADNKEDAIPSLAKALDRQLAPYSLSNLAPLEDILRRSPAAIETALDRRRIPRLSEEVDGGSFSWQGESEPTEPVVEPSLTTDEQAADELDGSSSSDMASASDASPSEEGTARPAPTHTDRLATPSILRPSTTTTDSTWRPHGDASNPPVAPGPGYSSLRPLSHRGRLRSYVEPLLPAVDLAQQANSDMREVQREAIAYTVAQESRRGCVVQVCEGDREAYDLEVTISPGEPVACVKVIGLRAAWDRAGIALRPAEITAASKLRERYWIFVVEHAGVPGLVHLTRIQDPAGHAHEYRFDDGWRALGETMSLAEPERGMDVTEDGLSLGVIETVKSFGELRRLTLRSADDQVRTVLFNPQKHLLSRK